MLSPLPSITSVPCCRSSSQPFPAGQPQPGHAPSVCFCHPQPLSSQPFHPAALPALGFLPCSALELLNPGLARAGQCLLKSWGGFAAPSASVPVPVLQGGPVPMHISLLSLLPAARGEQQVL